MLFNTCKKDIKGLMLLSVWISFFLLNNAAPVSGDVKRKAKIEFLYPKIETRYTVLHYNTLNDLKKFHGKIDYPRDEPNLKRPFSPSEYKDLIDSIKKKVDVIHARVQEILDIRKRIAKVNINLYHGKRFDEAFHRVAGVERHSRPIRSWYLFEIKTIYIDVDNVHEGVLAHEMAHHIIDHYLTFRPSKAIAEILAYYVDKHLH